MEAEAAGRMILKVDDLRCPLRHCHQTPHVTGHDHHGHRLRRLNLACDCGWQGNVTVTLTDRPSMEWH